MLTPPGIFRILHGFGYAFGLATAQITAGDSKAHPQNIAAVWQALWVSWLLILLAGWLADIVSFGLGFLGFTIVALIITLIYPVVSFNVVNFLGERQRYPSFIIAMTWLNNLRQVLVLALAHALSPMNATMARWLLLPVAIWMLWALWRVASQSLG